jgi:hypothetical protein
VYLAPPYGRPCIRVRALPMWATTKADFEAFSEIYNIAIPAPDPHSFKNWKASLGSGGYPDPKILQVSQGPNVYVYLQAIGQFTRASEGIVKASAERPQAIFGRGGEYHG